MSARANRVPLHRVCPSRRSLLRNTICGYIDVQFNTGNTEAHNMQDHLQEEATRGLRRIHAHHHNAKLSKAASDAALFEESGLG